MTDNLKITVFYDGACPQCVRDRCNYERWQKTDDDMVEWFDITGQEEQLKQWNIDPEKALLELHIRDQQGQILCELDAYRVLMMRTPRLKLLGWMLGLPVIRSVASLLYRWFVRRRLEKEGRLPNKS